MLPFLLPECLLYAKHFLHVISINSLFYDIDEISYI